ncbi:hypothetical protein EVAR_52073_1 [Eumeta japonica]|uniref:Uncharacterized protein n=1 Tax=Eumeta variegata TaxID=151549 RepID=A0A4C1Y113_EUMVA|nr:hypothetical protein EVAR_52073_1 [Eumeta japonica]
MSDVMEGKEQMEKKGPPERSLTGRNSTVKAVTSELICLTLLHEHQIEILSSCPMLSRYGEDKRLLQQVLEQNAARWNLPLIAYVAKVGKEDTGRRSTDIIPAAPRV